MFVPWRVYYTLESGVQSPPQKGISVPLPILEGDWIPRDIQTPTIGFMTVPYHRGSNGSLELSC